MGWAILGRLYYNFEKEFNNNNEELYRNPFDVGYITDMFVAAVRAIQSSSIISSSHKREVELLQGAFQETYLKAFDSEYMDPHGLAIHYIQQLSCMLKKFKRNPDKYHGPYSSIVTSSIMGKSRRIKQIAIKSSNSLHLSSKTYSWLAQEYFALFRCYLSLCGYRQRPGL